MPHRHSDIVLIVRAYRKEFASEIVNADIIANPNTCVKALEQSRVAMGTPEVESHVILILGYLPFDHKVAKAGNQDNGSPSLGLPSLFTIFLSPRKRMVGKSIYA